MINRTNQSGASRVSGAAISQSPGQGKKPKWLLGIVATVALFGVIFAVAWISGPMSDQEHAQHEIELCWGDRDANPVPAVRDNIQWTCLDMLYKYESKYGKLAGARRG
ncbi:hypothetical protein HBO15_23605 [Pseudomonas sp. WS 5111]|jgi:hypothetical protein|uniref:hypothetical protein n=1 Tax=unclassified Pseudomonas TaxID=196821 RepID=UPI001475CA2A|nr:MULTISPECIES: hypothetical protein [unclassified Pseudomonas]NMX64404.1 hypothetical protein [Pseudomonas sp. WS 5079]NMX70348.1 hypothetical protein [Pseudomonas sp. WS 5111]NMX84440.1 hypothetical protein [Pseudomonas sp. WS 5010]